MPEALSSCAWAGGDAPWRVLRVPGLLAALEQPVDLCLERHEFDYIPFDPQTGRVGRRVTSSANASSSNARPLGAAGRLRTRGGASVLRSRRRDPGGSDRAGHEEATITVRRQDGSKSCLLCSCIGVRDLNRSVVESGRVTNVDRAAGQFIPQGAVGEATKVRNRLFTRSLGSTRVTVGVRIGSHIESPPRRQRIAGRKSIVSRCRSQESVDSSLRRASPGRRRAASGRDAQGRHQGAADKTTHPLIVSR